MVGAEDRLAAGLEFMTGDLPGGPERVNVGGVHIGIAEEVIGRRGRKGYDDAALSSPPPLPLAMATIIGSFAIAASIHEPRLVRLLLPDRRSEPLPGVHA